MLSFDSSIVISPGHGGSDNGASYGYTDEDELNLSIAFLLECELRQRYFENITLTRERDVYVSLNERVRIAQAANADVFISIHCDAWHQKTSVGMTVHVPRIPTIDDLNLANCISKRLKTAFSLHRQRGIRKSNFTVLNETIEIPSILIECEFMSNPEQLKFLKKPENQKRFARAISLGIGAFLGRHNDVD